MHDELAVENGERLDVGLIDWRVAVRDEAHVAARSPFPCLVPRNSEEPRTRKSSQLFRWDSAVVAYLAKRRFIGRIYEADEELLRSLRQRLAKARAADLGDGLF